jgi:membrane protease YdiL (CAAX protease family)
MAPAATARAMGTGRAIAILLAYLGVQFAAGVVVYLVVALWIAVTRSVDGVAAQDLSERVPAIATMPSVIVGIALGAWVVFRMARRSLPGPIRSGALASLGWSRSSNSALLRAAAAGFAVSLFYGVVLIRLFPRAPNESIGLLTKAAMVPGWPRLAWIFVVLTAPPIEEFLIRGVLFTGFATSWGPTVSAILVTIIFVSLHLTEVGRYWPALFAMSSLAVMTLAVRLRSGSLAPAIAMHTAYNFGLVLNVLLRVYR